MVVEGFSAALAMTASAQSSDGPDLDRPTVECAIVWQAGVPSEGEGAWSALLSAARCLGLKASTREPAAGKLG